MQEKDKDKEEDEDEEKEQDEEQEQVQEEESGRESGALGPLSWRTVYERRNPFSRSADKG